MERPYKQAIAVCVCLAAGVASAQVGGYGGRSGVDAYGAGPPTSAPPTARGLSMLNAPNRSAVEQSRSYGTTLPPLSRSYGDDPGWPLSPPPPAASTNADPLSPTARYPSVTCHAGVCVGADGTQYAPGAGNVMFGSNGKVCQSTAPGAPLVCN